MRLTCPNCGAQYEVPDEVIPNEGRDVQCSNCGDTWYQAHPNFPEPDAETSDTTPEPQPAPVNEPDANALRAALNDEPPAPEAPRQQEVPAGITEILRQEAEREAELRAAEAGNTLESQPDLGLDNMPGDESTRRAQEARDRMARMRGQSPTEKDAVSGSGSRQEMLPDIEEISSSLRASDNGSPANVAISSPRTALPPAKPSRSGFARGFSLILIVGILMALVYVNASRISAAIPQAEPAMTSYVSMINQARVWMDAKLGAMTPRPEE